MRSAIVACAPMWSFAAANGANPDSTRRLRVFATASSLAAGAEHAHESPIAYNKQRSVSFFFITAMYVKSLDGRSDYGARFGGPFVDRAIGRQMLREMLTQRPVPLLEYRARQP